MQDTYLMFFEDYAATTSTENDSMSTNCMDLGGGVGKDAFGSAKNPNYGVGNGMYLNIAVNTAAASTVTTGTITFKLASCATTNGTFQSDATIVKSIGACTKGTVFKTGMPGGMLRYAKVTVTPASTLTAGAFTAW